MSPSETQIRPSKNHIYFKLPFIGKYSEATQARITKLCKKYCKETEIKIVYTSQKVKHSFSLKDRLSSEMNSNVVYLFKCANCAVSYVGETTRIFSTRIREHLRSDKKSHVYKHLMKDEKCFDSCDKSCFSVLDIATSKYQLKIKEGWYIEWLKPVLNRQVIHYSITLS